MCVSWSVVSVWKRWSVGGREVQYVLSFLKSLPEGLFSRSDKAKVSKGKARERVTPVRSLFAGTCGCCYFLRKKVRKATLLTLLWWWWSQCFLFAHP